MSLHKYDIIIIGGGISGLYTAYNIQKMSPETSFIILEQNPKKNIGGRIHNEFFYGSEVVTGAGIGRKHKDFKLIQLLYELNISYSEFPVKIDYAQTFEHLDVLSVAKYLRYEYKKTNPTGTFKRFATKLLGSKMYEQFIVSAGYRDYELEDIYETLYNYGLDDNVGGWTGLSISWSKMIESLCNKIGMQNIRSSTKVIGISSPETIESNFQIETEKGIIYTCNKIVLATTIAGIRELIPSSNSKNSIYQQIRGQPFLRVYGKFSKDSIEIMKQYVKTTTVVPSLLYKIIPINPDAGIYMIAYTDNIGAIKLIEHSKNTKENRDFYRELVESSLGITKNTIKCIAISEHYWSIGTHYYTPLKGYKNRKEFIKIAQHPMENMLIVGEMISQNQGWTQGALESVDAVISKEWIIRR